MLNDTSLLPAVLTALSQSRNCHRCPSVAPLAAAADCLLDAGASAWPRLKIRGASDISYAARAVLAPADRGFVDQLKASYSMMRHMSGEVIEARAYEVAGAFRSARPSDPERIVRPAHRTGRGAAHAANIFFASAARVAWQAHRENR